MSKIVYKTFVVKSSTSTDGAGNPINSWGLKVGDKVSIPVTEYSFLERFLHSIRYMLVRVRLFLLRRVN